MTLKIVLTAPAGAQEPVYLESVQVYPSVTGSRIVLQTNRPIAVVTYTVEDPNRLIVDPVESNLVTTVSPDRTMERAGLVTGWQVVTHDGVVDYLVFPVALPVQAVVYQTDHLVTIEVTPEIPVPPGPSGVPFQVPPIQESSVDRTEPPQPAPRVPAPLVARRPAPPAQPEDEELPRPVQRSPVARVRARETPPPATADLPVDAMPTRRAQTSSAQAGVMMAPPSWPEPPPPPILSQGPLMLREAVEKALAVHEPARIALEEAELAMVKIKEAHRNLFPGSALRGGWTKGGAAGASFREMQMGLQVEHPLYDAGRLRDAYKQAMVNLQVAQKRYDKVRVDFSYEVAQAYFELLSAQRSIGFRERLVEAAQRLHEATSRRFAAGLVTRMESLNVQSQWSQAQFQLQGARNDVAVAELKFRQRMQWEIPLPIHLPDQFPPMTVQVDLQEALKAAAIGRPDLQINSLLVEFHKYEEQMARKKEAWKLDLTGFAGASGGAYTTEPLQLDKDYSVAVKLSKPWGGTTGALTVSKAETSPRVGETTRTDSTSVQGEVGILNALGGATEIQQATVGRLKAQQDLADAKQLMEQEVHEAYYAYLKAGLTLTYAEEREQFRLEQAKIFRAQAELNEILPSQILEVELQLSDDQVSQVQAQASYRVAVARLNKAIGMTVYD